MDVTIDRDRLVDWASKAIAIPSFTGSEEAMAVFMADTFEDLGLQVQWQQVEDGRANVLGTLLGAGGGPSLMFNGHMDTSYSGRQPRPRGPVVLRRGAGAGGDPRLSASGVRPGRPRLRPRDLEHEGRARVLRGGA